MTRDLARRGLCHAPALGSPGAGAVPGSPATQGAVEQAVLRLLAG